MASTKEALTEDSSLKGNSSGNDEKPANANGTNYGSLEDNESTPLLSKDSDPFPNVVPNYYASASGWDRLVFGWLDPLLHLGNQKDQLDDEDLGKYPLLPQDRTPSVRRAFTARWKAEKERVASKRGASPSLTRVMFRAFGRDFVKAGLLKFVHDSLQFVGPHVLNQLIQFLRKPEASAWEGLQLTAAVTAAQIVMSLCLRHYFWDCYRTGLRVRSAIVVALYDKALKVSASERQSRSAGEITNLMSVDAQRLQDTTPYLHAIWYSVYQIGLAVYFLWQQLGPSCLAGVAVIILMMPLTAVVSSWMGRFQKQLMTAKDERVDVNNEVLGQMKVIKLQAWESSFQHRITELRRAELAHLFYYSVARSLTWVFWSAVPLLVALSTFAAYVWSGHPLDVARALTALALFEILRFPLFMFPNVIASMVEAGVALKRIQSFLVAEEHVPVETMDNISSGKSGEDYALVMNSATFVYDSHKPKSIEDVDTEAADLVASSEATDRDRVLAKKLTDTQWEMKLLRTQLAEAEKYLKRLEKEKAAEASGGGGEGEAHATRALTRALISPSSSQHPVEGDDDDDDEGNVDTSLLSLRQIQLQIRRGELVVLVGSVGCGKSTLLSAVLGEVRALNGKVVLGRSVNDKLGYFAQSPFIMNDTVRANILFGADLDVRRYSNAIEACALRHDLSVLPGADMCQIGEKGITLSGGQKARVALARAVYHNADLYLLDDPLAAVDAHVGRHLFEKCIVNELLLRQSDTRFSSQDSSNRKRTVVLVTNALQYLHHPMVDRIVVLDNGRVAEQGSYQELTSNPKNTIFKKLLASFHETLSSSPSSANLLELEKTVQTKEQQKEEGVGVNENEEEENEAGNAKDRAATLEEEAKNAIVSSAATQEEREVGHVSNEVYFAYIKSAGGFCVAVVLAMAYLVVEAVNIFSQYWLTYWSEHAGDGGTKAQFDFLAIYGLINLAAIVLLFFQMLILTICGLRASRRLFADLLDSTLKAPMSFYDTTPLGRVVNRFSKDIYTLDEALPDSLGMYLSVLSQVLGVLVVISTITPVFTVFLVPVTYVYMLQQKFFTRSYRELRRIDSVSRSPIYALFGESLDGVGTIRAFGAQSFLSQRLQEMLEKQQTAFYLTFSAQCWLAVRLEFVGTTIISVACLCAVAEHAIRGGSETFAGLAGLSISFALSVTQSLNWTVRMASDVEANMVAVERIRQYVGIPSEAPRDVPSDETVDAMWPADGVIEFNDAKLRYRPELPLVLKGLTLTIPRDCKVGVVGRTGAGKSTLMVALMRIVELDSGSIAIDGIDIKDLGLQKLRKNISVIPQDPCLFSGTVKTNLDPFNEYSDKKLVRVLRRVGLMAPATEMKRAHRYCIQSLVDDVLESGNNYSVGQRQLLVIARALLRESQIVIMDEATAAVDAETDARIQSAMRTEFKEATTITVAHRINTIMDSDYILVMDDGRGAEFDTPAALLEKDGGLFKDLVKSWEEEQLE